MNRLKFERRHLGLSQKELARRARVNQAEVSLIERGRLSPSDKQRQRLAGALGVDPDDLLRDVVVVAAAVPDANRGAGRA